LLEFRGAVTGANRGQIRKQLTGLRTTEQNGRHFVAKANQSGFYRGRVVVREFLTGVGDSAAGPIDILGAQKGGVALRSAGVPEEFVKVAALGIAFAADDGEMFRFGDGALLFEDGFGPKEFGKH